MPWRGRRRAGSSAVFLYGTAMIAGIVILLSVVFYVIATARDDHNVYTDNPFSSTVTAPSHR